MRAVCTNTFTCTVHVQNFTIAHSIFACIFHYPGYPLIRQSGFTHAPKFSHVVHSILFGIYSHNYGVLVYTWVCTSTAKAIEYDTLFNTISMQNSYSDVILANISSLVLEYAMFTMSM